MRQLRLSSVHLFYANLNFRLEKLKAFNSSVQSLFLGDSQSFCRHPANQSTTCCLLDCYPSRIVCSVQSFCRYHFPASHNCIFMRRFNTYRRFFKLCRSRSVHVALYAQFFFTTFSFNMKLQRPLSHKNLMFLSAVVQRKNLCDGHDLFTSKFCCFSCI